MIEYGIMIHSGYFYGISTDLLLYQRCDGDLFVAITVIVASYRLLRPKID